MSLSFTVYGKPAPQGSKDFKGRSKAGKAILIESSKRVAPWREAVKEAALKARTHIGHERWEGPVGVFVHFYFDRPKTAPKRVTHPITRSSGDVDKLLRATLDALVDAGVIRDDSQVVDIFGGKHFTGPSINQQPTPGAHIVVYDAAEVNDDVA